MEPLWQFAAEHFISFSLGVTVGFVATNRWKIVKRNGHDKEE